MAFNIMKLQQHIFIILFIISFAFISVKGQNEVDGKYDRLSKVYRSLELNTLGFNDLKRTWVLTDPVFVRSMFNKFLVNNGLRIEGKKPPLNVLNEKVNQIYNGNVFIDLRKRFYDDEIEYFRFYKEMHTNGSDSTDFFFDPIYDYIRLKEIIGESNYTLLRQKTYSHNDITKTYYDNKLAYKFDLYLSLINPEVMFYTSTTQPEIHNKYTLSFIGKWGLDKIGLPGWFAPVYVTGLKLNYIDNLTNNRPNSEYNFILGAGFKVNQPFIDKDIPSGKRLYSTGFNTFFSLDGDFLKYIDPSLKNYRVGLEGLLSINTASSNEMGINYKLDIQSIRNYLSLSFNRKEWVSLSNFGSIGVHLGFSMYDVYDYTLDPSISALQEIAKDGRTKFGLYTKVDLGKDDPLLGYMLSPSLFYNIKEQNIYFGFKLAFMISNSFGFDFSYYSAIVLGSDPLPQYRKDSYVVFSPVIRFNY